VSHIFNEDNVIDCFSFNFLVEKGYGASEESDLMCAFFAFSAKSAFLDLS